MITVIPAKQEQLSRLLILLFKLKIPRVSYPHEAAVHYIMSNFSSGAKVYL